MKQFLKILAVLGIAGLAVFALAQNTQGGTQISNTATATFTDSGGQPRSSTSNTVTTTVQTVYSFNVETDDSRNPAATPNFTGYTETDSINDKDVDAGSTVTFAYTVTNITNNDNTTADGDPIDQIPVTLSIVQASGSDDQFDLTGLSIAVYTFTDANSDGIYQEGETLGTTALATGTTSVTYNFQTQGERVAVVVTGTVPSTRNGNDIALIDVRATNNDATVDNTAAGANVYYENQNVSRVEVNEISRLGVAKSAGTVVNNGDGSFNVPLTFNLENFGNVTLQYIQVTENLSIFGTLDATAPYAAGTYRIAASNPASSDFTPNSSFNGSTNQNLLTTAAANDLTRSGTAGSTGSITLTVIVTPSTNLGPFNNQVTATGFSPDAVAASGFNATTSTPSTTDLSDNGTNPDPDDDNIPNETGENDVTPITLTQNPQIGVAKQAGTITNAADGDFLIPFTLTLENLGDMNLHDVQITESLADFGTYVATVGAVDTAGEYTISVAPSITDATATPAFAANSAFTGAGANTGLFSLASNAVLERGTTITVTFTIRLYPNLANSPFFNQVRATGDLPRNANGAIVGNGDVTDLSDNGTDPDALGDGVANEQGTAYDADNLGGISPATEGQVPEPTGDGIGNDVTDDDNDPTLVTLTTTARIGVAKQAGAITYNNNGTFTVPFTLTLENFGNVDLYDVQVTDSLSAEFGTYQATAGAVDTAGEYTVSTPTITDNTPGSDLVVNTGFTGMTPNTNLLTVSPANVGLALEVGQSLTISFNLTFYPNFANAPFTNQATATGDEPDGGGDGDGTVDNSGNGDTNDTSTNGTDPDDDNDGTTETSDTDNNPSENTPTPVNPTLTPRIGAAKQAGTVTPNGNGTFTVPFTMTLENFGNVPLYDVQVTDSLSAEFGTYQATAATVDAAGEYTVDDPVVTDTTPTPALVANTNFTGSGGNTGLFTVSSTAALEVGRTVTVVFNLTFYPNPATATVSGSTLTFNNAATASGDSPDAGGDGNGTADGSTTDTSTNGTDPDDDNDGTVETSDTDNNPNESVSTPIAVTMDPVIGIAKQAGTVVDNNNGTGTFTVPFTLTIRNYGNVDAHDVQIIENLTGEFGTYVATTAAVDASGEYTISTAPAITTNVSNALSLDAGFNGSSNQNMLDVAAGGHIRPGQTATITFSITFFPNFSNATLSGTSATFQNQVTALADNPNNNNNSISSGTANTTDLSDDGTNPDSEGDGVTNEQQTTYDADNNGAIGATEGRVTEPTGDNIGNDTTNDNNDPTRVVVTMNPVIGVAKTASITNGDTDSNPATAGPYELTFDLYLENLGNTNLTGVTLTDTLTQFGTLDAGGAFATGEYQLVSNTRVSSGPATITVNTDTDGTGPDTAFNGSGDTNVINTGSLLVGETAQLRVVIRVNNVGSFTNQAIAAGNGPGTTTTTDTSDSGTDPDPDGDRDPDGPGEDTPTPINLDAVQLVKSARVCTDIACGTVVDGTGAAVRPGQYIEYTIVARNLGGQAVTAVVITDPVPANTRFVYTVVADATAGITCSTAGAGGPFSTCTTTTATGTVTLPATPATHVRFAAVSLAASNAGTTDESTVRFVVYVP